MATQQQTLSPFGLALFLAKALNALRLQFGPEYDSARLAFLLLSMLTLAAVIVGCAVAAKRNLSLSNTILAVLSVFYALHPKAHVLHLMGLYPFALLASNRLAKFVWMPGLLWYLLFNGALGATGLPYFLAPWTGEWIDSYRALGLPASVRSVLYGGLILTFVVGAIPSALQLLRGISTKPRAEFSGQNEAQGVSE